MKIDSWHLWKNLKLMVICKSWFCYWWWKESWRWDCHPPNQGKEYDGTLQQDGGKVILVGINYDKKRRIMNASSKNGRLTWEKRVSIMADGYSLFWWVYNKLMTAWKSSLSGRILIKIKSIRENKGDLTLADESLQGQNIYPGGVSWYWPGSAD